MIPFYANFSNKPLQIKFDRGYIGFTLSEELVGRLSFRRRVCPHTMLHVLDATYKMYLHISYVIGICTCVIKLHTVNLHKV